MERNAILAGAESRIREHRTAEAKLSLVARSGKPLAGADCRVRLVRHEFRLGANAFRIGSIEDVALQRAYEERFAALMNYATLPFYWGHYEPRMAEKEEAKLDSMADWCRQSDIAAKGHPLVWHEVWPAWADGLSDEQALSRLEGRVRDIVSHYQGRIDVWDVVNEATVSHRYENAIGRWMKRHGAGGSVRQALLWAREASAGATLLYNDFNVSEDFEKLVRELLDQAAPLDVIGIQSHLHKGTWPIKRAWEVCETYARFALPLHFTELTVLSGPLKGAGDNDWHARRTDWHTTPEGEAAQADYGEALYTALFSHPAVEAITWWDFSDHGSWQGAPAGLVRADMTPKPLYDILVEVFRSRWTTDARVTTDASGRASVRCFFGEHEVEARTSSGDELKGEFEFRRRGGREAKVVLS